MNLDSRRNYGRLSVGGVTQLHPYTLAGLKGTARRISKDSEEASTRTQEAAKDDKRVHLNLLEMHKYDVTRNMGTILRQRYGFDSLRGIREAYSCAFSRKYNEIDRALLDDALDILSTLRNVIVHRASIADREYERRLKYLALPQ